MPGIQKAGNRHSGIHTGSGVKPPKLVTKGGKASKAKHQGYDGSTKGGGKKPPKQARKSGY